MKLVKSRAKAKFDETIDIAMNLGVDPKHADQMVRGVCNLPNGSGRTVRVAVFARGAKADEAKAAGADVVGAEDLVEQVSKGTINFDRCIATPDLMGLVGRLGKVLGPRGLMPNPRVGTVTMDVTTAVKGAKGGSVEFRVEKAGIVHAGVGKASFTERQLVENIRAFVDAVNRAKPAGSKGTYIRRSRSRRRWVRASRSTRDRSWCGQTPVEVWRADGGYAAFRARARMSAEDRASDSGTSLSEIAGAGLRPA